LRVSKERSKQASMDVWMDESNDELMKNNLHIITIYHQQHNTFFFSFLSKVFIHSFYHNIYRKEFHEWQPT
jgi:hypothetical protein